MVYTKGGGQGERNNSQPGGRPVPSGLVPDGVIFVDQSYRTWSTYNSKKMLPDLIFFLTAVKKEYIMYVRK